LAPDVGLAPPQTESKRWYSLKRSLRAAWKEVEQLYAQLAQRDDALAAEHEAAATWVLRAELAATQQAEHELATVRGEVVALRTA
jgi:hypothetical protein